MLEIGGFWREKLVQIDYPITNLVPGEFWSQPKTLRRAPWGLLESQSGFERDQIGCQ